MDNHFIGRQSERVHEVAEAFNASTGDSGWLLLLAILVFVILLWVFYRMYQQNTSNKDPWD